MASSGTVEVNETVRVFPIGTVTNRVFAARPLYTPLRSQPFLSPFAGSVATSSPPGSARDRTSNAMVVRAMPSLSPLQFSVHPLRFALGTEFLSVMLVVTVRFSAEQVTAIDVLRKYSSLEYEASLR